MEAKLFNADTGEIERSEVTNFDWARDLLQALLKLDERFYRAQLVEDERVLWDSYEARIARGQVVFEGVAA